MKFDIAKWLVIYYDCCVPKAQFKKVMSAVPFADHFFARDRFPQTVWKHDPTLFLAVNEDHRSHFSDRVCLFLTTDSGFRRQVMRYPVFNTNVLFMALEPCNSDLVNWIRAKDTATKLFAAHLDVLESFHRRTFSADNLRIEAKSIVREQFPENI